MSYISKRKLKKGVSSQLFALLFSLLGRRKDRADFQKIVSAILSPTEQIVISKRIAVLYLLIKKKDYYIIQDVLKVSSSTVSKCNMMLENNFVLKESMNVMLHNEQIKDLFQEVFSEIYTTGSYGVDWKNAMKRKNEIERKKREGI